MCKALLLLWGGGRGVERGAQKQLKIRVKPNPYFSGIRWGCCKGGGASEGGEEGGPGVVGRHQWEGFSI